MIIQAVRALQEVPDSARLERISKYLLYSVVCLLKSLAFIVYIVREYYILVSIFSVLQGLYGHME